MATHFKIKKHECTECQKRFTSSWKLKIHISYVHSTADSGLQSPCPECHKVFKNQSAMKNHLKYHKPPQYKCKLCEKVYHSITNLKTHVSNVHEEKREFQCKYCDSCYFKNDHLNRHILTAHLKQKIACQVEGCGKSFPLQERYRSKFSVLNPPTILLIFIISDHIKAHHQNLGDNRFKALLEGIKIAPVTFEHPEFELNPGQN
jgi:Zinc-finger double-stranded RNA-binding/C2H2-type zinc finger/Zinc finger, C2H2 type